MSDNIERICKYICETDLLFLGRYVDVLNEISAERRLYGPVNEDKILKISSKLEVAKSVYKLNRQSGLYFVITSNNLHPRTNELHLLFRENLSFVENRCRTAALGGDPEYSNMYCIFDKNTFSSVHHHTFNSFKELLESHMKYGIDDFRIPLATNNQQELTVYIEHCKNDIGILHITSIDPIKLEDHFEYRKMIKRKPTINLDKPFPQFKYVHSPIEEGLIVISDEECEICEHARGYNYTLEEDVTICPWCIADGRAAKVLGIEFNCGDTDEVDNKNRILLTKETPAYPSWQDHFWPVCCKDYCCFLLRVGYLEIEQLSKEAKQTITTYYNINELSYGIESLDKEYGPTGYLFQCLHCKKYNYFDDID